ncbi:MAG: HD domain-containing protein [Bacteroidales bacterium]|nr:HD domain-containing protein [Bacteroidales bacterium]
MQSLEQYVESAIISRYRTFDKAHDISHVRAVIEESLSLAALYGADADMVYVVAAYHDVGMPYGREQHHIHSARILMEDEHLRQWFTTDQLLIMKEAIEDHRASSKHAPRTIYGCIVADADRDLEADKVILRTMQYGQSHYSGMDKEQMYARTLSHLKEKYAEGGYLTLYLPCGKAQRQLEHLRSVIADENRLRQYFDSLYVRLSQEQ